MTCGVYLIRNITNGKIYIGSSINIEKRWIQHQYNLRRLSHANRHLQASWNKYGCSNFVFQILEVVEQDSVVIREQFYLDSMRPDYNISKSSDRPDVEISDEHKARISKANKGRSKTKEQRERISDGTKLAMSRPEVKQMMAKVADTNRGKRHTEEHKRKISESLKGRPGVNSGRKLSEEWRRNIAKWGIGKKASAETLKKRSDSLKGRKLSDEHRAKMSEIRKEWWARKKAQDANNRAGA